MDPYRHRAPQLGQHHMVRASKGPAHPRLDHPSVTCKGKHGLVRVLLAFLLQALKTGGYL